MPEAPLLIALDSATATASVAAYDGNRVVAETTWVAGREHSAQLLVELDGMLARIRRPIADVRGLVVARGPGSFTGVRVAMGVAKGIAFALGLPLYGVSALQVLACSMAAVSRPVRPVLEAGRGRYATTLYRDAVAVEPVRGVSLDELIDLARADEVVVGELDGAARERVAVETRATVATPASSLRRSGFLAELGWRAYASGERPDPALLDADYLAR